MEKLKIVLLILIVAIIMGGVTGLQFLTDSFPGTGILNSVDFTDPAVIVTSGLEK